MKQSKRGCKRCTAPIYWNAEDHHTTGKWRPFNADGTEHKCSNNNDQENGDNMGAPKARTIYSVNNAGTSDCTATVLLENGDIDDVAISALPRTDLRRAYAMAGYTASPTITMVAMVATLTGQEAPKAPTPAAGGSIDALVDARIHHAIETGVVNAGVDEAQVERIVSAQVDRIGVTRIEVRLPNVNKDMSGLVHKTVPHVVKVAAMAMATGSKWPLLVGPTGSGKSAAMHAVCEALGIEYVGALSCDETMDRSDLFGYKSPVSGEVVRTMFRDAYQCGGGHLHDELDNATANLTSGLNQALSNGLCAFPGEDRLVPRHASFLAAGAANTFGHGGDRDYVGRNELDAAFLNRWARIEFPYDEALERKAALAYADNGGEDAITRWVERCHKLRKAIIGTKARMFVTTRDIATGAAWIGTGTFSAQETEDALIWAGVSTETVAKVRGAL